MDAYGADTYYLMCYVLHLHAAPSFFENRERGQSRKLSIEIGVSFFDSSVKNQKVYPRRSFLESSSASSKTAAVLFDSVESSNVNVGWYQFIIPSKNSGGGPLHHRHQCYRIFLFQRIVTIIFLVPNCRGSSSACSFHLYRITQGQKYDTSTCCQ